MAYFDVNKIKVRFLIKYPYFASTLEKLEIVMDPKEATAATDGDKLYFSPEFMESLNEEQQLFTFAHEVLHVAFDHINRSEGKNHKNWNIATDAVINAYLSGEGLDQPPGTIDIADALNYCAEQIYNRLQKQDEEKKKEKQDPVDAKDSDKHGGGGEEVPSNGSSDNNKEEDKDKEGNSSSPSDKDNEKNKKDDDNVGHDSHSRWEDAARKHKEEKEKNGNGEEEKEEEIDERDEFNKNRKQKNKNDDDYLNSGNPSNSYGSGAGNGLRKNPRGYDDVKSSDIDWRRLLKENARVEYDWDMVDPELEDGVVVPVFNPQPSSKTEIVIDCSASISETLIKNFLKECMSIIKCSSTEVGFFDTKFYGFEPIRGESDIDNLEIKGGGGTDFNAAVGAFTNQAENKIIFTDGECSNPDEYCDAIWVVVGYYKHEINPPGGKVIYITGEEYEKLRSPSNSYSR